MSCISVAHVRIKVSHSPTGALAQRSAQLYSSPLSDARSVRREGVSCAAGEGGLASTRGVLLSSLPLVEGPR
eukprot:scaffold1903_cov396-Prasinococcus_capsulatus_cf.AAC.8